MANDDTTPYWQESSSMPRFPRLERKQRADVVVVGGGITGLTAAYLLAAEGRSVAVLERERCAQIDTGHTSAHLTMVTDARLSELVSAVGRDHAQAVWDAGLAAIAEIDRIVRDEAIACGFDWVPGYLHRPLDAVHVSTDEQDMFVEEAKAARQMGFDASPVDAVPLVGGPGVVFERQARFHPRKYLHGVARAATARGVRIFEHSAAEEFSDKPLGVKANGCTIQCDYLVIATHTPLMGNATMANATLLQTKLALYTTYVIAGRVEKGSISDALFWDTGDPYHYLRVDPHRDHDVVILGGRDHKTGQVSNTTACFDALEHTLATLVPGIDVTHRWSGQVIQTPDGLPYIGDTAERQFAATGFSGNGLTFGTLGGMMARDHILGRRNPWRELFDTGRTNITGGLWDYLAENKDYPYYMVRDRFAGAEARSLRAVKRGEGKIVELNGKTVAAYRDADGSTVVRSAVCPHMGCLVNWNDAERTWDCPCHGSRFKPNGAVIAGPAEAPLEEVKP